MAKGGKKGRRGKKNRSDGNRKIIFKEDDQIYGYVVKMLGDGRVTLRYVHEKRVKESLGIICGKMRKRVWIAPGDIVIASRRDFQENKLDIIFKYHQTQHRELIKKKQISEDEYNSITNINNKTEFFDKETKKTNKQKESQDSDISDESDISEDNQESDEELNIDSI